MTDDESEEKIEIFSTDDKKIKSFGELLTNDSSREILQLLFKEELTATQLAQKTDASLQLVKYHIDKMQKLSVIKVSRVEKNTKNQDMNYYTATKFAIVIMPDSVSERAKQSKLLIRSFKTIYRFAAIGVTAVASWLFLRIQDTPIDEVPMRSGIETSPEVSLQIIIPIIIVAVGLGIEVAINKKTSSKVNKIQKI